VRELSAVIRKELIHVRRDPRLVAYVVGLPVILLLLFGFALRLTIDDLTVAVWDQDETFFSLQVKDKLREDSRLTVVEVGSEQEIRDMLRHGRAHLGVEIPKGFSKRVSDGEQTAFPLFVDGTMPTIAQAARYGATVLTSEKQMDALALDDEEPPARKLPIKLEERILFNPHLKDSDFFLPGTMGIVIMLVSLTLATGLVREKEDQTIEQLWATPLSRFALIAGKMIPYALITTLDFIVVAALGRLIFDLPLRGSLPVVLGLGVGFVLSLLALGSLISAVSERQIQAHFTNVFYFTLCILLSGFVFPIEAMPRWLQPVSWSLPMTFYVEGVRAVMLKGNTAADVMRDFVALGAFIVGFGGLSVLLLRKQVG
jgi:ABC-type multidrug transport system permease subunit